MDPVVIDPIRPGDLGYVSLWVPDVGRAIAFYSAVLGWQFTPSSGPENSGVEGLNLSHGLSGGHEHPTLFLCFCVEDLDEALERIRAGGGEHEEPTAEEYGRIAMGTDPAGTVFAVYEPPPGPREARPAINGTNQGDLAYITMYVKSSQVVREFYGSVLGWQFSPGSVEDGWGVNDVAPMVGFQGGHEAPVVLPMYRVDDIEEAVAQVRAHGGTATDPATQPYAITSECTDDQGTRFYIGQH
jgi:predicted enzyme related to lactoylglutathione lyase